MLFSLYLCFHECKQLTHDPSADFACHRKYRGRPQDDSRKNFFLRVKYKVPRRPRDDSQWGVRFLTYKMELIDPLIIILY